ncbi:MAG: preprotein translocase subunit YajC [Acidobacteriota bacterium]
MNYYELMVPILMAPPGGQGGGFPDQLVLILIIFSIFYFIVFRPMKKRQRATEQMLAMLKNGDRVVTSGGIFGTVVGVSDDVVQLRVAEHVKIQVAKSAIGRLVEEPAKTTSPAKPAKKERRS